MMNSQMKDEHLYVWKCDKKFLSAYSTWLGIPTAGPAVGETAPAPGSGPDLVSFFKAENISGFVSNSARRSGDVFFALCKLLNLWQMQIRNYQLGASRNLLMHF